MMRIQRIKKGIQQFRDSALPGIIWACKHSKLTDTDFRIGKFAYILDI